MLNNGVAAADVLTHTVPGSYELPFAARSLVENARAAGKRLDAVVCIGVLIKGSTMHFEYICEAGTHGLSPFLCARPHALPVGTSNELM